MKREQNNRPNSFGRNILRVVFAVSLFASMAAKADETGLPEKPSENIDALPMLEEAAPHHHRAESP